jgi:hypothetical protein
VLAAQATEVSGNNQYWVSGQSDLGLLVLTLTVPKGINSGAFHCQPDPAGSASFDLKVSRGEYATPPLTTGGGCDCSFSAVPPSGTGRLTGTFEGSLAFYRPPADSDQTYDMAAVTVTGGVLDVIVRGTP